MVDKEALERLEHKAQHCVTHHHACDCREWGYISKIAELQGKLEDAIEKFDILSVAYKKEVRMHEETKKKLKMRDD